MKLKLQLCSALIVGLAMTASAQRLVFRGHGYVGPRVGVVVGAPYYYAPAVPYYPYVPYYPAPAYVAPYFGLSFGVGRVYGGYRYGHAYGWRHHG